MTSDEKTVARTPHSLQPTALSLDDIVGCRTSILWSLRTLQVGAAALDRSYEDFAEDVVSDDDYAADLIELYKAIELDKRYAEQRREITDHVLAWIGAALAARSDPAHQAALGVAQLARIDAFCAARRENFARLQARWGPRGVRFIGLANDPQDGMIPANKLVWTSDLEGQIGVGENFNAPLTMVGMHTITLTATDIDGNEGTDSIVLNIQ